VVQLVFRQARVDEVETVLSVLNDRAAWLRQRGVAQWPAAFRPDWVTPDLLGGTTWLATLDGNAVGTMALNWVDPLWPDDGVACYVHRLAARRCALGLGAKLLDHATGLVAARGRQALRLDCVADNDALRRHYRSLGFQHRGDVELPEALLRWWAPPLIVSRYERPVLA
jgi:ribosomal protein S18 acetylase RimI-like enzyme